MALKDILPGKLGFGTAPLGNMFRDIPEAEARATVDAAWNDGIRFFDNAPFYGAGLAEIREFFRATYGPPPDDPTAWYAMDVEFMFGAPPGGTPVRGCIRARPHVDPP